MKWRTAFNRRPVDDDIYYESWTFDDYAVMLTCAGFLEDQSHVDIYEYIGTSWKHKTSIYYDISDEDPDGWIACQKTLHQIKKNPDYLYALIIGEIL